MTNTLAYYENP